MADIPSAVDSNRRWSATQGRTAFSLSGAQMTGGGAPIGWHPYAVAGGEHSFLSVDEKMDKGTAAALPTFVKYVHPIALHPPSQ